MIKQVTFEFSWSPDVINRLPLYGDLSLIYWSKAIHEEAEKIKNLK